MAETRSHPKAEPEAADAPEDRAGGRPVCTVAFCPICMAVTAGQGAAPDVIDHLLAAAREFFLAARAVIDVRGDQVSGDAESPNGSAAAGSSKGAKGSKRFERIEIG